MIRPIVFKDRIDAGEKLAKSLVDYAYKQDTVVIALPRGGVVVGYEIAKLLHLPLDIVCPRKIGAPFNPELAIGAITETGEAILADDLIRNFDISQDFILAVMAKEKARAKWRLDHYRQNRPPRQLAQKTVILVDDGLATGATMRAAIKTIQSENASSIILAVPLAPEETLTKLKPLVDQVICLSTPSPFYAVGQFYTIFDQISDTEVTQLLDEASKIYAS